MILPDFSDDESRCPNYTLLLLVLIYYVQHKVIIHFQNEAQYDQIFNEANFKTYIFKLRAKVETYNVSKHDSLHHMLNFTI